jgi:hypothetical protein
MEREAPFSPPPDAHESISGSLIAYSVACLLVVVTVVSLRLHIRVRLLRKFGGDDIALAITTVRIPNALSQIECPKQGALTQVLQFSTVVSIIGITSGTCASPSPDGAKANPLKSPDSGSGVISTIFLKRRRPSS